MSRLSRNDKRGKGALAVEAPTAPRCHGIQQSIADLMGLQSRLDCVEAVVALVLFCVDGMVLGSSVGPIAWCRCVCDAYLYAHCSALGPWPTLGACYPAGPHPNDADLWPYMRCLLWSLVGVSVLSCCTVVTIQETTGCTAREMICSRKRGSGESQRSEISWNSCSG